MRKRFKIPFFKSAQARQKPADIDQEMAARHVQERAQFKAVLESINVSRVQDRLHVLDAFLAMEDHITLTDLSVALAETMPALDNRAFLAETMEMFCQSGFAQKQTFASQETTYEHNHLGMHHDHFICTSCGLIQEFSNPQLERLQTEIAGNFNFHPLQHKMEIYGLCADCMARREPNPPLSKVANGEQVKIVELIGGRKMQARLMAMGFAVGTTIEVINNNPAGPFVVALGESRVALCSSMAEKILVSHACRHAKMGQREL